MSALRGLADAVAVAVAVAVAGSVAGDVAAAGAAGAGGSVGAVWAAGPEPIDLLHDGPVGDYEIWHDPGLPIDGATTLGELAEVMLGGDGSPPPWADRPAAVRWWADERTDGGVAMIGSFDEARDATEFVAGFVDGSGWDPVSSGVDGVSMTAGVEAGVTAYAAGWSRDGIAVAIATFGGPGTTADDLALPLVRLHLDLVGPPRTMASPTPADEDASSVASRAGRLVVAVLVIVVLVAVAVWLVSAISRRRDGRRATAAGGGASPTSRPGALAAPPAGAAAGVEFPLLAPPPLPPPPAAPSALGRPDLLEQPLPPPSPDRSQQLPPPPSPGTPPQQPTAAGPAPALLPAPAPTNPPEQQPATPLPPPPSPRTNTAGPPPDRPHQLPPPPSARSGSEPDALARPPLPPPTV